MVLVKEKKAAFSLLKCSQCSNTYPADKKNTYASCELCDKSPLLAQYDFSCAYRKVDNIDISNRSMWRYRSMLPVFDFSSIVTLGEGWTPLLQIDRMAKQRGVDHLVLKDESLNPTGSFKARGLSMAISKAKELGIKNCIIPTAGNAGGAMSAYCAKAGLTSTVIMPRHTPKSFKDECEWFGANLILVDGLINDCARKVAELNREGEYFDMSTFKEPYRLEGKKTMGYEIAEQTGWDLPDVILYPTGGGTGLVGMWKAFNEMIQLGWIKNKLPRMVVVQSENCQPIFETWFGLQEDAKRYKGKPTLAYGLAVPNPLGEKLILNVLAESHGTVVSVSDEAIAQSMHKFSTLEGLLVCPEGAALDAALIKLLASGAIRRDEKILMLNTGSGYKYLDSMLRK
jgi:threonine synthase